MFLACPVSPTSGVRLLIFSNAYGHVSYYFSAEPEVLPDVYSTNSDWGSECSH